MAGFFLDAHNQTTGAKLADGPIVSVSRFQQRAQLSRSGTWGADLAATEARINHTDATAANRVLDSKRQVRCHAVRGDTTIEVGAGIIDTLGIVAASYEMDMGGNDLAILLGNPTVHELALAAGTDPLTVKAAVEAIAAYAAASGLTFDTTSHLSHGDTASGTDQILNATVTSNFQIGEPISGAGIPDGTFVTLVDGTTVYLSQNATATATGIVLHTNQVLHQFSGESVLTALVWLGQAVNEDWRLEGDTIVWLYRSRESCGLYAVAEVDPIAVLTNDDLAVITGLEYQRASAHIYNRIFPYGAGSGSARETIGGIDETELPLPPGYDYFDVTIGSVTYWGIQHTASVTADGAIERDVSYREVVSPYELVRVGLADLQRNLLPLDTYSLTLEKVRADVWPGETIHVEYHDAVDGYRPLDINADLLIQQVTSEVTVDGSFVVGLQLSNQRRWPLTNRTRLEQMAWDVETVSAYAQPQPIADSSVTTDEIADDAVTPEKVSSGLYILGRDLTPTTITNSAAETSIASFTVPGGTLGTDRMIRVRLFGSILNNTGATATLRLRFKYGGTTVFDVTTGAFAASASARGIRSECLIVAAGATGAQVVEGTFLLSSVNATAGTTTGGATAQQATHPTVAVDSTVSQTLEVTAQLGAANANLTTTILAVVVEVVK